MGAAMSLDITGERIETVVQPKRMYTPTILSEIEFAIRQHFDRMQYPKTLESTVHDVELKYSIKEGEIA